MWIEFVGSAILFFEVFPREIRFSSLAKNQQSIWLVLIRFDLSPRLVGHVYPAIRNETLINLVLLLL